MTYSLLAFDDSLVPQIQYIKSITSIQSLIENICDVVQNKFSCGSHNIHYEIQFLTCSSKVTSNERKNIMRRHRRIHTYEAMEPVKKKTCLENRKVNYATMNASKKTELLRNIKENYQLMDPN